MAYAINEYNFWSNPKVREAGKDAALMYLAGNSYCNEFMTDGLIVFTVVSVIANLAFQTNPEKAIKSLVDNHLWIKVANGYKVHDYLKYNKSKAEIERLKSRCSTAGKASGKARASEHVEQDVEQDVQRDVEQDIDKTLNPISISYSISNSNADSTEKESINQSSSIEEKSDDDDVYLGFRSIGACTPEVKKAIDQAVSTYGEAWVKDAIAEGVIHQAKSFAYVSKILASWKANGKPSNGKSSSADIEKFRQLYSQRKVTQ